MSYREDRSKNSEVGSGAIARGCGEKSNADSDVPAAAKDGT